MNFLGGLSMPGFAGGMFPTERPNPFDVQGSGLDPAFDTSAGIDDALARNQQLAQQRQQQDNGSGLLGKAFGQKTGGAIRNVLGAIADSLLVNAGHAPIYAAKKQAQQAEQRRARLGQMLGNYLGNSDAALAELFEEDPDVAMKIYEMKNKRPDLPADVDAYEYAKGQGFTGTYMDFLQQKGGPMIASNGDGTFTVIPRAMQQPQAAQQGPGGIPTVSDQASYDAVPAGGQYRDPQGNLRTKGGPTAQPSATFPAQ